MKNGLDTQGTLTSRRHRSRQTQQHSTTKQLRHTTTGTQHKRREEDRHGDHEDVERESRGEEEQTGADRQNDVAFGTNVIIKSTTPDVVRKKSFLRNADLGFNTSGADSTDFEIRPFAEFSHTPPSLNSKLNPRGTK